MNTENFVIKGRLIGVKNKFVKEAIIPEGITSIESKAFFGCNNLENVEIPNSVKTIGEFAFSFSGLTTIKLPDGIKSIKKHTFEGCSELTSIRIPESVRTIRKNAFLNCKKLTSIFYNGTVAQWYVMRKKSNWNGNVPSACMIYCKDRNLDI